MYVKGAVLGQGRQHVSRRNSVGGQGGQAGHLESSLTPSLTSQVPLPARLSLILLIRKMGVSLPAGRAGREWQALHTEEAGDWYGKENVNIGLYRPGEGAPCTPPEHTCLGRGVGPPRDPHSPATAPGPKYLARRTLGPVQGGPLLCLAEVRVVRAAAP